ncbi:MAG: ABC transporter permease subunit [Paracoccaceae bacterium]|nr:ABC transporter permease subunit [Paracoccaceae bacterium]
MIARILATAICEAHIARRNLWIVIAVALMVMFSLVLSAVGSVPSGELGADRLSITVASLTSLAVYLVPLVALLMSFDAIAGEVERGTLPLVLTYPIGRWEILAGKLLAHTGILIIALVAGYGAAGLVAVLNDPAAVSGIDALWRLTWTSVLLGASFLGLGYALSALAGRASGAAGLAIGVWLGLVVLYDLALLAAVVVDQGGAFSTQIFPSLLLANPADAFRLFNLTASQATAAASGIAGAAGAIALWQSLLSLLLWPFVALGLATVAFRKVEP